MHQAGAAVLRDAEQRHMQGTCGDVPLNSPGEEPHGPGRTDSRGLLERTAAIAPLGAVAWPARCGGAGHGVAAIAILHAALPVVGAARWRRASVVAGRRGRSRATGTAS